MKKLFLLAVCMFSAVVLFAQRYITGRITDEKGNPLVNASVKIKGTSLGEKTDQHGGFRIQVPENAPVLDRKSVV